MSAFNHSDVIMIMSNTMIETAKEWLTSRTVEFITFSWIQYFSRQLRNYIGTSYKQCYSIDAIHQLAEEACRSNMPKHKLDSEPEYDAQVQKDRAEKRQRSLEKKNDQDGSPNLLLIM
jgi:hypothetical protein